MLDDHGYCSPLTVTDATSRDLLGCELCSAPTDTLRLVHGGTAYTDLKLSLATPGKCAVVSAGTYTATDFAGLEYAAASELPVAAD